MEQHKKKFFIKHDLPESLTLENIPSDDFGIPYQYHTAGQQEPNVVGNQLGKQLQGMINLQAAQKFMTSILRIGNLDQVDESLQLPLGKSSKHIAVSPRQFLNGLLSEAKRMDVVEDNHDHLYVNQISLLISNIRDNVEAR